MPTALERYYSAKSVAEKLDVSPRTVNQRIQDGSLRGVRIGRIWRISESAILEYLEKVGNRQ